MRPPNGPPSGTKERSWQQPAEVRPARRRVPCAGLALAAAYLERGRVTATVHGTGRTDLHDLADSSAGRLAVETVDITISDQVTAVHARLTADQSVPGVLDTVAARSGTGGLRFLDHRGQTVRW
ncbi:hypothetical protein [Streptomyces sp. NBC_01497]|uniref:hypothetical protein n=1 Tax=Streptomyces sp. NBC_01497 TaxID=2903885 RepID=UPI002E34D24E|nr:hypothetical protein [Streptomyces sp. NBC_01497]